MTVGHPPTPGTALWVLAHPRQDSLNGHLWSSPASRPCPGTTM